MISKNTVKKHSAFKFIAASMLAVSSLSAAASSKDLTALSDCEFSEQMLSESVYSFSKAIQFYSHGAIHSEIAQWRVRNFNPAFAALKEKYKLNPQTITSDKNREVSSVIYTEFLGRLPILVQEINSNARYGKNEDGIKQQWRLMKQAANVYAEKCDQKSKLDT